MIYCSMQVRQYSVEVGQFHLQLGDHEHLLPQVVLLYEQNKLPIIVECVIQPKSECLHIIKLCILSNRCCMVYPLC